MQLVDINGALSGLRQFLTTESLLKMMKNTFHSTLKVLFFLKKNGQTHIVQYLKK